MIRHAGTLISRYQVGSDGRTAHERLRGRPYDRAIAEFGEKVLYSVPGTSGRGFRDRWKVGVYLGARESSNDHLMGTPEGVVKAKVFRHRPIEEQWDKGLANTKTKA